MRSGVDSGRSYVPRPRDPPPSESGAGKSSGGARPHCAGVPAEPGELGLPALAGPLHNNNNNNNNNNNDNDNNNNNSSNIMIIMILMNES